VLHSGKAVIQHIYDSHYEGAEEAQNFVVRWRSLEGHLDESRYRDILARFEYQAQEAILWRDTICRWIYELSHIRDAKGRVAETNR
jgi:alpha-glucuronidase